MTLPLPQLCFFPHIRIVFFCFFFYNLLWFFSAVSRCVFRLLFFLSVSALVLCETISKMHISCGSKCVQLTELWALIRLQFHHDFFSECVRAASSFLAFSVRVLCMFRLNLFAEALTPAFGPPLRPLQQIRKTKIMLTLTRIVGAAAKHRAQHHTTHAANKSQITQFRV